MSVKFERDTLRQTTQNAASNALPQGQIPGTSGKHPLAEKVGTALTGGIQNAGTKGYLAVRGFKLPTSCVEVNCRLSCKADQVFYFLLRNIGLH